METSIRAEATVDDDPVCVDTHALFQLLGKPYMLSILEQFVHEGPPGPRRFVDLQEALSLSPNTLSGRLKELVAAGLLSRTVYNEIPPRVDYEATEKAKRLCPVFDALAQWARQNRLDNQDADKEAVAAEA